MIDQKFVFKNRNRRNSLGDIKKGPKKKNLIKKINIFFFSIQIRVSITIL